MKDLKLFGAQLQRLRREAGLSQERLVAALDRLAQAAPSAEYRVIDGTLISRWEQARIQKGRAWRPTRTYFLYLIQIFADYLDSKQAQQWAIQAGYRLTPGELQELFPTTTAVMPSTPSHGEQGVHTHATRIMDVGEMPVAAQFHGRAEEVTVVLQWLGHASSARLIAVLGMGGIGKTALAAHVVTRLTTELAEHYTFVLWRSLLNAPPLAEILQDWLQTLSRQTLVTTPASVEEQIQLLLNYLRRERCLLILDNLESILQAGEQAGQMRSGYEAYAQLLQQVGSSTHRSCLLLTSREQPQTLDLLLRVTSTTHVLRLTGLDPKAGEAIIHAQGLTLLPHQATTLVTHYSGNPLALQIVASTIADWFAGDIDAFQREGAPVFADIRAVLDQQFARLSDLEREILIWLAIEREAVTATVLRDNLVQKRSQRLFLEALRSLERRSFLRQQSSGITLQNVIIEYTTDRLIEAICMELSPDRAEEEPPNKGEDSRKVRSFAQSWLNRFALLKAQAKEYVRQSQERLIVQPISARMLSRTSRREFIAQIDQILGRLRAEHPQDEQGAPGYAAGNLLNLLIHLGVDLMGYDFSRLAVWQAYLQGVDLPAVNFTHADLRDCVFTKNFGLCRVLAFTPDGSLLGGGMTNGEIHLWQPDDGQPVAMLKIHETRIWDIAFSPDGQTVISGSKDQTVRLTDRSTGRCLHIFSGHTDWVRCVAFAPNGQIVASGSQDQTVRLWEIATGETLRILPHQGRVLDLAFSPDGAYLASGGTDQTVRLWEVATGQELAALRDHRAAIYAVLFSPDGKLLATGSDDLTLRLWDTAAIAQQNPAPGRAVFTGHRGGIYGAAFSPDGRRLFSGGAEATIRVWDVATGQLLHTLAGHHREANALAMSPDGTLLATGETDTSMIYLWDLYTADTRARAIRLGYRNWTNAVAFHPDLPLLAGASADGKVYLWHAATGQYLQTLHGERRMSTTLAFSHATEGAATLLAAGSTDYSVRLWSFHLKVGAMVTVHPSHRLQTRAEVHAVAFRHDSQQVVAGSYDGVVHHWDTQTGDVLHTLHLPSDPRIKNIALQATGQLLAVGSHQPTVVLCDLTTGAFRQLQGHTEWVWTVAFHPSGQILASGSHDRTVRLWDVATGQLHQLLPHTTSLVYALAFNRDGTRLAVGTGEATIYLWDTTHLTTAPTTPPRLAHKLQGHFDVIQDLAFSADGQFLASASLDGKIKVWEVQTGDCLHTLYAPGPYAGMKITGVTGITAAQQAAIQALGAVTA